MITATDKKLREHFKRAAVAAGLNLQGVTEAHVAFLGSVINKPYPYPWESYKARNSPPSRNYNMLAPLIRYGFVEFRPVTNDYHATVNGVRYWRDFDKAGFGIKAFREDEP